MPSNTQQLVQPEGTILDLRSSITGITQQQLAGIQLDRLQLLNRYILPRLGPGVVLVGHALHNDLNALQLDHQPVIDTSLLFSYK
jgi:RNA exonuclease 1